MRSLFCLVGLLASLAAVHAEEARNVPALGAKLTFRMISTTTMPSKTTGKDFTYTTGEVYTDIVTAADATSAEGIIKPRGLIVYCPAPVDRDCKSAAERPGAHFDGDLLTIPIAGDIGDALAKQSAFRYAYFMQAMRKFPRPGDRDLEHPVLGDIGPEASWVLTTTINCDPAALAAFVPVGAAPHAALTCETSSERTISRDGHLQARSVHNKVTYDITYTGDGRVSLPSGDWAVKKLSVKTMSGDHTAIEGESLFSPQLGVSIKTHLTGEDQSDHARSERTTELIAVER